jgi:hypothetical protein
MLLTGFDDDVRRFIAAEMSKTGIKLQLGAKWPPSENGHGPAGRAQGRRRGL